MAVIAPPYGVLNQYPSKLFIDGEWVDADNGKTFKVYNPANGDVLKEVPEAGADETRRAIEAAQRALPAWSGMSGRQRSQYLFKAYQLIRKHRKELATLLTLEQGKTLEAAEAEVVSAGAFLSWYVEEAKRINSEVISSYDPTKRVYTLRQPVGVVVAVTPWNFPADMVTRKVGPALAAGCTVVLKPSSQTPLIAMALTSLFEQAGLPKGVLNLVVGRTGEIGVPQRTGLLPPTSGSSSRCLDRPSHYGRNELTNQGRGSVEPLSARQRIRGRLAMWKRPPGKWPRACFRGAPTAW
ncbi:MAG: aldehyde dehydrogenase family protein [Alicyclobacillaceae bacterium]|nr:aldehyde dehydrogenase family protein [Alicyclobacillaceae bacterium]